MEKSFPGIFGWSIRLAYTYLDLIMLYYIHRTYYHIVRLSKTRFIRRGQIFVQHSNTPALPYSNTPALHYSGIMLSAEPVNCDPALRTNFSILKLIYPTPHCAGVGYIGENQPS